MWGDEKFRALSKPHPNGQSLWVYLLTGPHATGCPGIFHVGEMALAENLNWPLDGLKAALRELANKGMVKVDSEAKVVVIPNVLKYDEPQSPNVAKKWGRDFDEIPECPLKNEHYLRVKAFIEVLDEAFVKAFDEGCGKAFPKDFAKGSRKASRKASAKASRNPDPEPDPEPEPKPEPNPEPNHGAAPNGHAIALSKTLFEKIKERDPKAKEPNWKVWSRDMGLLLSKDGREPAEVEAVIQWCQSDRFWYKNILSPKKLREQFTRLRVTMNGSVSGLFGPQPGIDAACEKHRCEKEEDAGGF